MSQKDSKFEEFYQGAKAVGIPIGCYWYSYAITPEDARKEAEICLSVIQDKELDFPIYFDLEEKKALNTGKTNCSNMIRAFCETLENAGYLGRFSQIPKEYRETLGKLGFTFMVEKFLPVRLH